MKKIRDQFYSLLRRIFDKIYFQPVTIGTNVISGRISGLQNVQMEGYCRMEHECNFAGVITVGERSTFGHRNLIHGNVSIGRYCQIGSDVMVNSTNHPVSYLSTYIHKGVFKGELYRLMTTDKITIGHDVWIGHGVVIVGGVTIGNGAIIAAGAVVTKDVRPYAIVGGVPARELNRRFSDTVCEEIDALQWWNLSEEEMEEKKELFFNNLKNAASLYD